MRKDITHNISLFFMAFICLTTANSCYYDNEQTLYPEAPCDTLAVMSYSSDIVPILSVNCYNCHSLTNAPIYGENLVLEGYANLVIYLNSEPEALVNSIQQNGKNLSMPRGAPKLAKCSISNIEQWIKQGKRNN